MLKRKVRIVINDLKLAIAISERFNEPEMVVTRGVFFEVLDRMSVRGDGQVVLNRQQTNSTYPFMHRIYWRGITFVHFSRESFAEKPCLPDDSF